MDDTENILDAPLRHHLQLGSSRRIRLCSGPTVDEDTLATLRAWQRQGVSYGLIIDRLTSHALSVGYNPATTLSPPYNIFLINIE